MKNLEEFQREVGSTGAVAVQGGQTHWDVGGSLGDGVRLVSPPAGIDSFNPSEMTVAVNAGTKIEDLNNELSTCLLYTSPSPRDLSTSRMPSSA